MSKGSIRLLLESSPSDTFPMHVWRNKMCVDTTQAAPPLPLNSYVPFLLLHKLLPAPLQPRALTAHLWMAACW